MTFQILNPVHPGELLREDIFPAFNVSQTEAADRLRIARKNLSFVVNGRSQLTPELAAKVEAVFGVDAALLVAMQGNWNLAQVRRDKALVEGLERMPVPA